MRRVLFLLGLAALAGAATGAAAQQPPLIDRELFFGDPEISGAQISPDGRYISFRKPYRGVMNIWVKGVDEPFDKARPITADQKRRTAGSAGSWPAASRSTSRGVINVRGRAVGRGVTDAVPEAGAASIDMGGRASRRRDSGTTSTMPK